MIRLLYILYSIFAAYIYGYGSFLAGRHNESLFSGPEQWLIVDFITLLVFYLWSKSDDMNERPESYLLLIGFVTFLGLVNFLLPIGYPWYFDFGFWNFTIALGAAWFALAELSTL